MSPIRFRKQIRFGPFSLNFTQNGFSSWGVKVGPWSWNSRTRRHRSDLPGPLFWESGRRQPPGAATDRRRQPARPVRATLSLLFHMAAAVALIVALEPLLHGPHVELAQDAITKARGIGLTVALIIAVAIWGLPSLLPRRPR